MEITLIQTNTIEDGLNAKSKKPNKFFNSLATFDTSGNIRIGDHQKISKFEECEVINYRWFRGELYVTIRKRSDSSMTTWVTEYPFLDVILWFHVINMSSIMAWIGGILSIILTIKEIFQ